VKNNGYSNTHWEAIWLLAIKNVTMYTITDGVKLGNILVDETGPSQD
jgi:hypothetical protein